MKAAVYLRVSTERQDEANQEPETLRLAEARGWDARLFRERESGAKDRPEWSRVMDQARKGEVRAVVIWSLDRVGRRMFELISDVRELHRYGCAVVSVREPWLDTGGPAAALLLAIFAWVAEHERERLRERTHAGLARARAQGKVLGRKPSIPAAVVERAAALKKKRHAGRWGAAFAGPEWSWSEVAACIADEGLGKFKRGALERACARLSRKGG